MISLELHKAQIKILRTLRYNPTCRYTELQKPTGLDSDVFKFHLRKLVNAGYIRKDTRGHYELTPSGKEFANNLSKHGRGIQKQPKISVLLIIKREEVKDRFEYLFQSRNRSPYFDYSGLISGPVQWGEDVEDTAKREALKQTGLSIEPTVSGFVRQQDFADNTLLEDKMFVLVICSITGGQLRHNWQGGKCEWLTIEELEAKPLFFEFTKKYIELAESQRFYSISKPTSNHLMY